MPSNLEIELSPPNLYGPCECCGGTSVRLTRFVHRDGDAHAVYYAAYANNHPEHELHMLVSIGEWGEGSEPSQRDAFFCRLRATDDAYELMLEDAATSPWSDAEIVGKLLSQDEARAHQRKTEVFEIADEAVMSDPQVKGFFARLRCGDPSVPLEYSFAMPDDVFELDAEDRKRRAQIGRAFVVLDGARHFIRCLVPIAVDGHGEWRPSVWIEVSADDFARAKEVWDDEPRYAQLCFTGTTANSLQDIALPLRRGTHVTVGVGSPAEPPRLLGSSDSELAERLRTTWAREAFEEYAVDRGFL
jgi:hypothetical protein